MCDKRVALVTGSTSGIGLGIVRRLAAEGYFVVVHSRTSADAGRALADELGDALYIQADLARDEERRRLVHETVVETWEAARTLWREHSPMRRAATPADIAQCVTALIDSDYLTGEVLLADGGLNLT